MQTTKIAWTIKKYKRNPQQLEIILQGQQCLELNAQMRYSYSINYKRHNRHSCSTWFYSLSYFPTKRSPNKEQKQKYSLNTINNLHHRWIINSEQLNCFSCCVCGFVCFCVSVQMIDFKNCNSNSQLNGFSLCFLVGFCCLFVFSPSLPSLPTHSPSFSLLICVWNSVLSVTMGVNMCNSVFA